MYEVRIANLLKLITPPYVTVYCFSGKWIGHVRTGTLREYKQEISRTRIHLAQYNWLDATHVAVEMGF